MVSMSYLSLKRRSRAAGLTSGSLSIHRMEKQSLVIIRSLIPWNNLLFTIFRLRLLRRAHRAIDTPPNSRLRSVRSVLEKRKSQL